MYTNMHVISKVRQHSFIITWIPPGWYFDASATPFQHYGVSSMLFKIHVDVTPSPGTLHSRSFNAYSCDMFALFF